MKPTRRVAYNMIVQGLAAAELKKQYLAALKLNPPPGEVLVVHSDIIIIERTKGKK